MNPRLIVSAQVLRRRGSDAGHEPSSSTDSTGIPSNLIGILAAREPHPGLFRDGRMGFCRRNNRSREGRLRPTLRIDGMGSHPVEARGGRCDQAFRSATLDNLEQLPIREDAETYARAWRETLSLASRYKLTTYDAAYLELAQRRQLPLATLDTELRNAGRLEGLPLLGI